VRERHKVSALGLSANSRLGKTANLLDISLTTLWRLSHTPDFPKKYQLGPNAVAFRAAVIWAAFEIPKGLARYRAGIQFLDADQTMVARFIQANTAAT